MFGKKKKVAAPTEAQLTAWHDERAARMARALGPEHDMVLHYIIHDPKFGPYHTHLYYDGAPGTGMATMQLARLEGDGPTNSLYEKYEMVAFTRQVIGRSGTMEDVAGRSPGGLIRAAVNAIGAYAFDARLEPFNTLEFPDGFDGYLDGRCFQISPYKPDMFNKSFGLMLLMEIHRDEMAFARQESGLTLVEKLQEGGVYPYSDMDRPSVISSTHR